MQVPWEALEPITGQDRDAAAAFAAPRLGEAGAKGADARGREAARLGEAGRAMAELTREASSGELGAAARGLVTGCVVDAEGGLALDLAALSSAEGGLGDALAAGLPLLAARGVASELRRAVPPALERLQAAADAAAEQLALRRRELSTAEGMSARQHEAIEVHRARVAVAGELLECAAAACACYEDPRSGGGTVASLRRGREDANKAREALAAALAQAEQRRAEAERDREAADARVRDLSGRLDAMASELLPLAGEDVAQEEGRAAGEALGSLRQAAKAAAEHLERMQGLVQALQASSGACTKVLEGEEQAA